MKGKFMLKVASLSMLTVFLSFGLSLAAEEMVLSTWGGMLEENTRKTVVIPFEKATGVKVQMTTYPDFVKVKAMVDTGNIEWDVVDFEEKMLYRGAQAGILEPLDYSMIDTSDLIPEAIHPYGLGFNFWAGILAYNTEKFPNNSGPKSWADFWDVEKFPGVRALFGNPFCTLEVALLADGVSLDELYPLDVDRAFRSLDRIKPHIAAWWKSGAQAPQLLTDGEVDMCYAYSGRIVTIKNEGIPVHIEWNQALLNMDYWVIPKGAKGKDAGMKYIAFDTQADIQANYGMATFYGPTNKKAWDRIDPQLKDSVAGNPEMMENMVIVSGKWWAENEQKVVDRWTEWMLE